MGSPEEFVYDVGFSLPPLYTCPPVSPQLGTARYYTMKSVYRGKDEQRQRAMALKKPQCDMVKPDKREILDFGLASLNMEISDKKMQRESHNQLLSDFTKRRHYFFRCKGLEFNQLHSINRNKEERLWEENSKKTSAIMSKSKKRRHKLDFDRFRLPPIAEYPKHHRARNDNGCTCHNKCNSSVCKGKMTWEQQISERIRERLLTANQTRAKHSNISGQDGKLVSSRRLRQILDGPATLYAGNFYMNGSSTINNNRACEKPSI